LDIMLRFHEGNYLSLENNARSDANY